MRTPLGQISPTPSAVYEHRLFSVRLFGSELPFEGIGFFFKAPYGTSIMGSEILARAVARNQIDRFQFGKASKSQLRKLDRRSLLRFDEAFERVGLQHGINWAA